MQKLKITQKQIDAISNFAGMVGINGTMKHHVEIMTTTGYNQPENKSLNEISIPDMARIFFEVGSYEIKEGETSDPAERGKAHIIGWCRN